MVLWHVGMGTTAVKCRGVSPLRRLLLLPVVDIPRYPVQVFLLARLHGC